MFGLVASDPTISRLIDTLAGDSNRALAAINTARAAARATAWTLAGDHAPDHDISPEHPVIADWTESWTCRAGPRACGSSFATNTTAASWPTWNYATAAEPEPKTASAPRRTRA